MLRAPTIGVRLLAANYFLVHAQPSDLCELHSARSQEADYYVRLRLEQAIRVLSGESVASEAIVESAAEGSFDAELIARATEWVGGVILHEMEGHLGRAALYASREVEGYASSKTKVEIEGLRNIFRGVSQMVTASKAARPFEFDVSALISNSVASLGSDISLIGPRPFLAIADETLLGLAITNGLKNAIEATALVTEPHPIVVNWGITDRDYWVTILDKGAGVSGSAKSKFRVGTSTKSGHSGFGLAVAKRVMQAMGGQVSLASGSNGGALYELRWSRVL
jgi:signal transduction histidine kinase